MPNPTIYGHPFAMYCWKVYIALRERGVTYETAMVDPDHAENTAFVNAASPMGQFPVLDHEGRIVVESDPIIEYLDLAFPGTAPMVPEDRMAAIEARQMAGIFDDYVAGPLQQMVFEKLRPVGAKDPHGVETSKAALERTYRWLDKWMDGRTWAANETFGIAECAAGPALFYSHWAVAMPDDCTNLRAYHRRLLDHPSIASVIDDARLMRDFFPLKGERDPDVS
ncbi:MAG: glutathione S-transferase family protein [Henriciella sp.]